MCAEACVCVHIGAESCMFMCAHMCAEASVCVCSKTVSFLDTSKYVFPYVTDVSCDWNPDCIESHKM